MESSVRVERVGPDGIALVLPLFEGYRDFYGREADPERSEAFLRTRIARGESVIFAALAEPHAGRAVGFVQLYPSYSSLSLAPVWVLNDLYVDRSARRGNVGRLLVEHVTRFARESGAASISLETATSNHAAKRLYDSLGYEIDTDFDHYTLDLSS